MKKFILIIMAITSMAHGCIDLVEVKDFEKFKNDLRVNFCHNIASVKQMEGNPNLLIVEHYSFYEYEKRFLR